MTTSLGILATIKIGKVLIVTDAVSELFDRTKLVSAVTCTLIMRLSLIIATIMETVFLSEGMVEASISTSEPNNLSSLLNFYDIYTHEYCVYNRNEHLLGWVGRVQKKPFVSLF